ncbi:hypothetical protein [Leptospira meyeri]|uniref:hypothetical protein n=1 Tax=Leptospira meyeri TaxID=29508 RepID=UPI00223CFB91|nr:hypothetical protein [Leptospira meyeri]MCW7489024.1 hypothetical protein [Leptospira meyeri]
MKNFRKKIVILITLLIGFFLFACNFKEQCESHTPNDNYDLCFFLVQNYHNSDEERKRNMRVDLILTNCLITYQDIKKCKKEPTAWPIPDAIID